MHNNARRLLLLRLLLAWLPFWFMSFLTYVAGAVVVPAARLVHELDCPSPADRMRVWVCVQVSGALLLSFGCVHFLAYCVRCC